MPAVILPRNDHYVNKGPHLRDITTSLLVLATTFVILRFVARLKRGLKYGADDWMIVVSLVSCFALGAINYSMIRYGLGRHADTLQPGDLVVVFKLLLAFECVYVTTVALVKISLLLMYTRIFSLQGFKVGAYILGSITICWWIAINCVCVFQCNPIKKAWLPTIPGSCINLKASFIGNAVPNILTDVAILCMPIGQVLKLHISPAQRLSLCFIFLLGSFVLFASIYRFTTIMQFQTNDTTWTLATACTWCVVEVASGIISACLPTLRPLMKMVSSQFGSGDAHSERTSRLSNNGELVTIGGTGSSRSKKGERHFKRLDDLTTLPEERYDTTTIVTRPTSAHGRNDGSGDEIPLTSIAVGTDVQ